MFFLVPKIDNKELHKPGKFTVVGYIPISFLLNFIFFFSFVYECFAYKHASAPSVCSGHRGHNEV